MDRTGSPRTVVITGAGAGIGLACARAFAAAGANVGLLARSERGLAAAAAEAGAHGVRVLPVVVNTCDSVAVDDAAARVERELGPIDVWVNDAFTPVFASVTELEPEEFTRVAEMSCLACVYGSRAALAHMLPRDRGVIVQVGPALAHRDAQLPSAYRAAEHAIRGFHESLRHELLHEHCHVRAALVQILTADAARSDRVPPRLSRARCAPSTRGLDRAADTVLYAAAHPRRREYRIGDLAAAEPIGEEAAEGFLHRRLARTAHARRLRRSDWSWDPERPAEMRDCYFSHAAVFDDPDQNSSIRRHQPWAPQYDRLFATVFALAAGAGGLAAIRKLRD
jgi:NADP-dependent 3-hydroxy acid dehydrogenase YdfG